MTQDDGRFVVPLASHLEKSRSMPFGQSNLLVAKVAFPA